MRPQRRRPKNVFRRFERWLVGLVMGVIAFGLEKVVMRSVKKGGASAPPAEPTSLTARGGDVDLPER
jgi:hypothetical protein